MKNNTAIRKYGIGLAFTCGMLMSTGLAHASTIYQLDVISGAAIGSGSQGTVTLTEVNANQVDLVVSLVSGVVFVNTGGPHTPFTFNLDADDAGSIVTVTSPWFTEAPASATPYGTFTNGIGFTGDNGGPPHGQTGPLTFSVFNALGLTIADFVTNSLGYLFAADVFGTSGGTGSVAANLRSLASGPSEVPLPAGLVLLVSALGGLGFLSRLRKTKAANEA